MTALVMKSMSSFLTWIKGTTISPIWVTKLRASESMLSFFPHSVKYVMTASFKFILKVSKMLITKQRSQRRFFTTVTLKASMCLTFYQSQCFKTSGQLSSVSPLTCLNTVSQSCLSLCTIWRRPFKLLWHHKPASCSSLTWAYVLTLTLHLCTQLIYGLILTWKMFPWEMV